MTGLPVVNAAEKYINGLNLAWASATTLTVAAGRARNSGNENDIILDSAVTIDGAANGLNGLDIGSLGNNTFYAVYAIDDSFKNNAAGAIISADLSSPLMPFGYDMMRRIGYVKTDGSAEFLEFRQEGAGVDRWMWYDAAIATDITAGASATFAAVDLSDGIPSLATGGMVNLLSVFDPTAGDDTLELRPGDSSATDGYARLSGSAAGVTKTDNMVVPYDATTGVDYKVTGSGVALSVAAYLDQLA